MKREPLTDKQAALAGPRSLKEPGSAEWCWQTLAYLKNCYRHVEEQYKQVDQVIEDLERVEAWKVIPPEKPYGTLERMVEIELGVKLKTIRTKTAAARAKELDGKTINSGDGPIPKEDNNNRYIITVRDGDGGTSADYLTRRIVRDHPEIAEKMRNGEYRSVRAAALEAGIVKRTCTIRTDNPESIVGTLRRQLDPEVLSVVTKLLTEGE